LAEVPQGFWLAQAGLSGHVSPLCRLIGDMLGKGNRSTLQWLNFLRTKRIYHPIQTSVLA